MARGGAAVQILFDASDYARVGRIYQRMPRDLQKIAFRRAAARARGVVERDYARFASRVLKVAQKLIKARMRSYLEGGDVTLVVNSTNIPLNEMNPKAYDASPGRRKVDEEDAKSAYGVFVRERGRYEGAIIASQASRRMSGLVIKRVGKARLPVKMLFGPNPANAVNRKPADYEDILAEIAAGEFAKTILQQAEYLLARGG